MMMSDLFITCRPRDADEICDLLAANRVLANLRERTRLAVANILVPISASDDTRRHVRRIESFLNQRKSLLEQVRQQWTRVSFAVMITATNGHAEGSYTRRVYLRPQLLELMNSLGVSFDLEVCPGSDEA